MADLENSLFTEWRFAGFAAEGTKMYIFRYSDGKLAVAPNDFSPDSIETRAAKAAIENVDEIYVISKTLVKQLKLVVKDKAEIAAIRKAKAQDGDKK